MHPPTGVPANGGPSIVAVVTRPVGANVIDTRALPVGPSGRLHARMEPFAAAIAEDAAALSKAPPDDFGSVFSRLPDAGTDAGLVRAVGAPDVERSEGSGARVSAAGGEAGALGESFAAFEDGVSALADGGAALVDGRAACDDGSGATADGSIGAEALGACADSSGVLDDVCS